MTISFRESGRKITESWRNAFFHIMDEINDDGGETTTSFGSVDVSVMESFIERRIMAPLLQNSVQKRVENDTKTLYVSCVHDIVEELHELGIRNRLAGYVFLLDSQARIRWKVAAPYSQHDDTLVFAKVLQELLKQHREKNQTIQTSL